MSRAFWYTAQALNSQARGLRREVPHNSGRSWGKKRGGGTNRTRRYFAMPVVTMKNLLEAGVHFGHQTRRWNPKMKPYIFTERKRHLHPRPAAHAARARALVQLRPLRRAAAAARCCSSAPRSRPRSRSRPRPSARGMPYVNNRWLGGMLTNFVTMRGRVKRMEELEAMDADGRMATLPKKEQLLLRKELGKLQANLNGVRDMRELPGASSSSTPSARTSRSTRPSACASRSSASSTPTPIRTTSTTSSRATTTRSARSA